MSVFDWGAIIVASNPSMNNDTNYSSSMYASSTCYHGDFYEDEDNNNNNCNISGTGAYCQIRYGREIWMLCKARIELQKYGKKKSK
jgi:hypothetical protein